MDTQQKTTNDVHYGWNQHLLTQVVEATLAEDLGTSLEPDGLRGSGLVQLRDEDSQGTEKGPAGMDDLHLTVPLEGLGISGQTSGILRQVGYNQAMKNQTAKIFSIS